jgi:hypothetical protein
LFKHYLIDLADLISAFATRRARKWLARSRWCADFAESVESGQSISDIRNEREREGETEHGVDGK